MKKSTILLIEASLSLIWFAEHIDSTTNNSNSAHFRNREFNSCLAC